MTNPPRPLADLIPLHIGEYIQYRMVKAGLKASEVCALFQCTEKEFLAFIQYPEAIPLNVTYYAKITLAAGIKNRALLPKLYTHTLETITREIQRFNGMR